MQDLVLYAVNDYYRKQKSEEKDEKAHIIPGPDEDTPELSTEGKITSLSKFPIYLCIYRLCRLSDFTELK